MACAQSCMVHGGDGFAFVIHLDPNATATLGAGGEGMGYAGIRNSLVVEFDTWYNPAQGDLFTDHVRCVRTCAPLPERLHCTRISLAVYSCQDPMVQ